jgi:CheY-like chemotaxis protein
MGNMSNMASSAPGLKQKVLVVEDDAILRALAMEIFSDAGFETIEASNADEAVLILETHLDIRIVFTDIDMPGSLDGIKLAACIRDRWPPIEIILTSGQYAPKDYELPPRSVFIPKPYQFTKVVEVLNKMAR